jgi:hypothetical protein
MDFEVGKLTIPLFIGTVLNWALLGTLAVQVFIYFLAFPNDHRFSKILVASIVLAELLQTLGDSRDTIRMFGAGWGNPEFLDKVGWAWFSVPVLGSAIAAAGQMFFAWRIYIISNKGLLAPCVIAIVTAVQLGAGIWSGVEISRAGKFSVLQFDRFRSPVVWLAATALSDFLIVAGTSFYVLKGRQPGFRRGTDAVIFRIIRVTVETGLVCALFALIDLSMYVSFKGNNYHLAVCIWLSKVYSNSILVILNSRASIAHAPATQVSSQMTEVAFRSRSGLTSVQVAIETRTRSDESQIDDESDKFRERMV